MVCFCHFCSFFFLFKLIVFSPFHSKYKNLIIVISRIQHDYINATSFLIWSSFLSHKLSGKKSAQLDANPSSIKKKKKYEECKKWHEDVILSQIKSFCLFDTELPEFPNGEEKYTTLWQYQGRVVMSRVQYLLTCFFFFSLFMNSFCLLVNCLFRVKTERGESGTVWTGGGRYIVTGLFGELSCSLAFFSSLTLQDKKR